MLLDQDHLRVALRNIVTECRCGLHPWEQYPERPTRSCRVVTFQDGEGRAANSAAARPRAGRHSQVVLIQFPWRWPKHRPSNFC